MKIRTIIIKSEKYSPAMLQTKRIFVTFVTICIISLVVTTRGVAQSVQNLLTPFTGEKTSWHGFDRYDFIMDEETLVITPFKSPEGEGNGVKDPAKGQRRCFVIVPKVAASGSPWSWRGCYWDQQSQTEVELLNRGFHVAYISANQNLKPGRQWDAWYEYLTGIHGLSQKPNFIGMSRGGEYSFIWATTHPDKVSCLYTDNTGGNWGIINGLTGLVINDVPILLICGSIDPILGKYSLTIEKVYQQFGGRVSMMIKEDPIIASQALSKISRSKERISHAADLYSLNAITVMRLNSQKLKHSQL